MLKNDYQYYTSNRQDKKKQSVVVNFKRVTPGLEIIMPTFVVDFKYPSASVISSRIRYFFFVENLSGDIEDLYHSNECMGKAPYSFSYQSHLDRKAFFNDKTKRYIFEFWDGVNNYLGQAVIERKVMLELMEKKADITLAVSNEEPFLFGRKVENIKDKSLKNLLKVDDKKGKDGKDGKDTKDGSNSSTI